MAGTAKLCFAHAADFKQVTLRVGDIKVADAEGIGYGFSSRKSHAHRTRRRVLSPTGSGRQAEPSL